MTSGLAHSFSGIVVAVTDQQLETNHPGGWPRKHSRMREAWWVLTGQQSLHRAWQRGYDQHTMDESARRARGGK